MNQCLIRGFRPDTNYRIGAASFSSAITTGTVSRGTCSSTPAYTSSYGITGWTTHVGNLTTDTGFVRMNTYDVVASAKAGEMIPI